MKSLVCENCSSKNVLFDNDKGVYVCQNCATSFSPEHPNKLIIEGSVEVKSIGSIDGYLTLAILYEKNEEYKKAIQYYEKTLELDSHNEAAVLGLKRLEQKIPVNITRRYKFASRGEFIIYLDHKK